MRIFERLRGRDRSESGIERQVDTIVTDLLRSADAETPVKVVSASDSTCCSCCSADNKTRQ